jgi:hypothetical protein
VAFCICPDIAPLSIGRRYLMDGNVSKYVCGYPSLDKFQLSRRVRDNSIVTVSFLYGVAFVTMARRST